MPHSSAQMGRRTAITKNGIQQITKAPVMIARVLAAFLSLFDPESFEFWFLRFKMDGLSLLFLLCCMFCLSLSLEFEEEVS